MQQGQAGPIVLNSCLVVFTHHRSSVFMLFASEACSTKRNVDLLGVGIYCMRLPQVSVLLPHFLPHFLPHPLRGRPQPAPTLPRPECFLRLSLAIILARAGRTLSSGKHHGMNVTTIVCPVFFAAALLIASMGVAGTSSGMNECFSFHMVLLMFSRFGHLWRCCFSPRYLFKL